MHRFLIRFTYKVCLCLRINILWIFWYPRYFSKLSKIKKTLTLLTKTNDTFQIRYPFVSYKLIKKQFKYWIHWVRKMDHRERIHFKEFNPIFMIGEEEYLHFNLTSKDMQILNYLFYWPDSIWISQPIFNSFIDLVAYFNNENNNSEDLINLVNNIERKETSARIRKKYDESNSPRSLIIDKNGIRLSQEFLNQKIPNK
jgi:hypothetical protein